MRLLILTFYYEPDLSAGSFRATALVKALLERAPAGTQIEVLTTLPNRYRSYSRQAAAVEESDRLEIRRIELPTHRSDMLGQARAFTHFARRVLSHARDRHYDLVFATSSRLMTAVLGAWVARRTGAPLYLDIRDIFVETISELLPASAAWPIEQAFSALEAWAVRRAARVNVVSAGFDDYFLRRYPHLSLAHFTNGIDDEFLQPPANAAPSCSRAGRVTILYAGNLGEGQGLHRVLPGLARALADRAHFLIIGDGGRREHLAAAVAGLDNVELRPPVSRSELLEAYNGADVLFLHLGDYAAFERVLPSKLFEYAALGKPILAGVAGYAARFVSEEIENAAVFAPCDVDAAVSALATLDLRARYRESFVRKFARANIVRAMVDDILALRAGE